MNGYMSYSMYTVLYLCIATYDTFLHFKSYIFKQLQKSYEPKFAEAWASQALKQEQQRERI
jgi:hypothetical protein